MGILYGFAFTSFTWVFGHLEPSICQSMSDLISLHVFISLTVICNAGLVILYFRIRKCAL